MKGRSKERGGEERREEGRENHEPPENTLQDWDQI